MDDMTRFEQRFEDRVRAFAKTGTRSVDSAAVARAAIGTRARRDRGADPSGRWYSLPWDRRTLDDRPGYRPARGPARYWDCSSVLECSPTPPSDARLAWPMRSRVTSTWPTGTAGTPGGWWTATSQTPHARSSSRTDSYRPTGDTSRTGRTGEATVAELDHDHRPAWPRDLDLPGARLGHRVVARRYAHRNLDRDAKGHRRIRHRRRTPGGTRRIREVLR